MRIAELLGRILFTAGALVSERAFGRLENGLNYLAVGRWVASRDFGPVPGFSSRYDLFEEIGREVGDQCTLYMEFGVYQGESMRCWSSILHNPDSLLHGFDSFEGLPEDWTPSAQRGRFSTNGAIPEIEDPRVSFFKGWFDQTLPQYEFPEYERLVVGLDADLYSSTKFVLEFLEPRITTGTILYFDEFRHRNHEMKAFLELEGRTGMSFSVLGQSRCWEHAAFVRTA